MPWPEGSPSARSLPKLKLDIDYITHWAARLDQSIGSDEVTERVTRALAEAKRR